MDGRHQLQRALSEVARTGRPALDCLLPTLYDELKVIARRHRRRERRNPTLNTTDLVHEAYVKLVGLNRISWQNRAHVLAVAARAMRRLLVDHAIARRTLKRGGQMQRVELEADMQPAERPLDELIAIDTLLQQLEAVSPRLTRVVECRFFAGMSIEETAQALDSSPATVKRDWNLARAWLNRALAGQLP
ncbi:MAG TPA: ECF-type sigma factor [Vicinamibacterales bacterium]|nr:ECF-type sigma factor [Vicinamibacterales bacterium]